MDNLVFTAETKEEVAIMFRNWQQAMEEKELKVNIDKAKMMVTGEMKNLLAEKCQCGV